MVKKEDIVVLWLECCVQWDLEGNWNFSKNCYSAWAG
jgi:hypothetical protein